MNAGRRNVFGTKFGRNPCKNFIIDFWKHQTTYILESPGPLTYLRKQTTNT